MHMTSAPHLLAEDRAEYERLLDEILRNARDRPDLAAVGHRLNATQLRTMALNATTLIATAAAAEYEHYVEIREEARNPGARTREGDGAGASGDTAAGRPDDGGGAGFGAVIAVLAPVLAGTAAVIFLLVGHLLELLDPAPAFAKTLIAAGWLFGGLTAAAILAAAVSLLVTALRNSSTQLPAEETAQDLPDEVARAKDAWRHALLERGILPFLRAALSDPSADPASGEPPRPAGRIPEVGYSGPDYTSPAEGGSPGQRPAFTSPDFTGPEYGGPENLPE
jgi:hypothetical protein